MKIGIIRADRMGDMILTLPIIKAIKIANPKAIIHVFCSNKNFKVVKEFKYINKIFNINISYKKEKVAYDYLLNFTPGWKSFFICSNIKSNHKSNIILTSRYRKKLYSKILIIILSKIFFKKTLIIDRINRYVNKASIHQTKIMFELLKICNIPFRENILIENFLEREKTIKLKKKLCLIHLSSKWINKYYNEDDFLILVSNLRKKFNLLLTTDETTYKKFVKINSLFPSINNKQYYKYKFLDEVIILENMDFNNWINAINSSSLVITPECGCTHIAAICKIPTKIIYDADNKPDMINKEFSPWQSEYEKFIFDDIQLNLSLIKNL